MADKQQNPNDNGFDGQPQVDDLEESDSNEVSREKKHEFVSKIKKLTNQGLTSLVQKIKEVKAQSITDLPEEKIQIRIDDFDKAEFAQISEKVDELLIQELPSKR